MSADSRSAFLTANGIARSATVIATAAASASRQVEVTVHDGACG